MHGTSKRVQITFLIKGVSSRSYWNFVPKCKNEKIASLKFEVAYNMNVHFWEEPYQPCQGCENT